MRRLSAATFGFLLVFGTTACTQHDQNRARQETRDAGHEMNKDLNKAGQELKEDSKDAAYKTGKAAHKLADETKEAAQKLGKKLDEAGKDAKRGWEDAKTDSNNK
jgi:hypothetical protein